MPITHSHHQDINLNIKSEMKLRPGRQVRDSRDWVSRGKMPPRDGTEFTK